MQNEFFNLSEMLETFSQQKQKSNSTITKESKNCTATKTISG